MEFLADQNGLLYEELYRERPLSEVEAGRTPESRSESAVTKTATKLNPFTSFPRGGATYFGGRSTNGKSNVKQFPLAKEFVCRPKEIMFGDFQIGETYSLELTMTNVSTGFSTFRMMAVPPAIRGQLAIKYEFPSRIPAGLSWPVTILFTPTKDEDIDEILHLRTDSGTLPIKLMTRAKKANIAVSVERVNLGVISIGEQKSARITLKNTGALGGMVSFGGTLRDQLKDTHINPVTQVQQQYIFMDPAEQSVFVHPHSEQHITITFAPFEECEVNSSLIIKTKENDNDVNRLYEVIPINARSTGLPVYVETPEINFQWCFYGETYHKRLRVANASSVSAQVTVRVPSFLKDAVHCEPESMTVQPGSTYETVLFFTPGESLGTCVESLAEFQVKGQALPTAVFLTANLTGREFNPSENTIDLASFAVNEDVSAEMLVKNECLIPQKVWVADVPPNIIVDPLTATLLPGEEFPFLLTYRATEAGPFKKSVTLNGQYGPSRTVSVIGETTMPSLVPSESFLKLPVCTLDGTSSATFILNNVTDSPREFSFHSPCDFVKVSPSAGVIEAGKSSALTVFMSPRYNVEAREMREPVAPPVQKPTRQKLSTRASAALDADLQHTKEAQDLGSKPDFNGWEEISFDERKWWMRDTVVVLNSCGDGSTNEVFLGVRCVVSEATFVVRLLRQPEEAKEKLNLRAPQRKKSVRSKKDVASDEGRQPVVEASEYCSTCEIDFGDVAFGGSSTRVFLLRNIGAETTPLRQSTQCFSSTFPIIKPLPLELIPNKEAAVVIQFTPGQFGVFSHEMKISAGDNDVTLKLRGRCCETDVSFTVLRNNIEAAPLFGHPDEEIVFPASVVNERSELVTSISNAGAFPVKVSMNLVVDGEPAYNAVTQPFVFYPSQSEIPAKSKANINLYFAPRAAGLHVAAATIMCGSFSQTVRLKGLCSDTTVYTVNPGRKASPDYVAGKRVSVHKPACEGASGEFPLQLQFVKGESKTFVFGSVKDGPPFEYNVEGWDDNYSASGWSVSATRDTCASGAESKLAISFSDEASAADTVVSFCRFSIVVRCPGDPANDRTIHVSCTGP